MFTFFMALKSSMNPKLFIFIVASACSAIGLSHAQFTGQTAFEQDQATFLQQEDIQTLVCAQPLSSCDLFKALKEKQSIQDIQRLIFLGADVNVRDEHGDSVVLAALAHNRLDVLYFIFDYDLDTITQEIEIWAGLPLNPENAHDLELVNQLIAEGIDWNQTNKYHIHLFASLIEAAPVEVLEKMIAAGADVNAISHNGYPLESAAAAGDLAKVDLLLKAGAHPNAVDDVYEHTPLHWVMLFDHDATIVHPIMEHLLAAGANPNIKDKDGCTPLHYITSRSWSHEDIITGWMILHRAGADINIQNKAGLTPMDDANQSNIFKIDYLICGGGNCTIINRAYDGL